MEQNKKFSQQPQKDAIQRRDAEVGGKNRADQVAPNKTNVYPQKDKDLAGKDNVVKKTDKDLPKAR